MMIARFATLPLLVVCMAVITACSAEKDQNPADNAPAAVESAATPEAPPAASPTPALTPDTRTRTERIAEQQRQVQEIVRQKQLERAKQQEATKPPGTETQYQ